jgi:hypothetical protein
MEQDVGGAAIAGVNSESVLDQPWLGTSWHTAFRIKKALKTSGRIQVAVVGEVTNPANLQRASETDPVRQFLGARTARLGIVVGF